MLYIAICDDDEKIIENLNEKVQAYLKKTHELAEITLYSQSRMLQYDIEEGKYFDLILSDIEMPHIDGMDLAEYMKKYLPEVLIIFITSYLKYAIDAYELSVFRYIPKNMLDERLERALSDAIQMIKLQSDQFYKIDMPSRIERIPYHKILYIRREGKYAVFYLLDGSTTKVRKSLSQVYDELDDKDFIFVDRGDIANLAHIMSIRDGIIELKNGESLPVSHSKLEEIKAKLSQFWEEQI